MTILGSLTKDTDFTNIQEISDLSVVANSNYSDIELSSASLGTTKNYARVDYLTFNLDKWYSQADILSYNAEYTVLTAITLVSREDNVGPWNISIVATKNMNNPFAANNVIAKTQYATLPNNAYDVPVKYVFEKPVVLKASNTPINNELSVAFMYSNGTRALNVGIREVLYTKSTINDAPVKPVASSYMPIVVAHVKTMKAGTGIQQIESRLGTVEQLIGNLPATIDAI